MTTGQHPKTLRTAKDVAADLADADRTVLRPYRRNAVPIVGRTNRDLSPFEGRK